MNDFVEFRDVHFSYDGTRADDVLADFSLGINNGEFFVLLGPSGCGKTTALNLVAGFERPTMGSVTVDGKSVEAPTADRTVIFQGDDSLFPWLTARQNVEFALRHAKDDRRERIQAAERHLELTGLGGEGHKYPSQLSGGMKQRVQLARALAGRGRVLLMDEPFGAIDALTRSALQDEVARIWHRSSRTILFITHDIAEAVLLADRIGVMEGSPGRLTSVLDVQLERPRSRAHPDFAHMYGEVEAALRRASNSTREVTN